MTMITEENIDEYLMLYTDGELSVAEEQALLSYVKQHPEYYNDLNAYKAAKLEPVFTAYPDKKSLIKKEPAAKIIAFRGWVGYGIAAGVAAIMVMAFFYNQRESKYAIASKTHQQMPGASRPAMPVNANGSEQKTTIDERPKEQFASKQPLPKSNQNEIASLPKPKSRITKNNNRKEQLVSKQLPAPKQNEPGTNEKQKEEIARLEVVQIESLPSPAAQIENAAVSAAQVPTTKINHADNENLLDKLPIDDTKRKGIEILAENITDKFQHVSALKKRFDEKNISVRVQKRKLIISF